MNPPTATTETADSQPSATRLSTIAHGVGEVVVAAFTVLAIAGGLSVVAGWREQSRAAAPTMGDADGTVTLRPYRAAIDGDLKLYPTDFEDQATDYTYTHGRKVVSERMERKVGDWTDPKASLGWKFSVNQSGEYKVRARYSCDEESAGNTIRIEIGDDTLSKTLASTGGWDRWSSVPLGRVKLAANRHDTLQVHADELKSERFVNLEHVRLTPVEDDTTRTK